MIFNDKFKPLFEPPEGVRYFVVTGGRFSSKSYSVSSAVCALVNNEDRKALYTRYTLTAAKDSIIPEFVEKINLLNLADWYEPKQDRIEGVGDREVVFKGIKTSSGNQTAKLKSLKGFSIFVLDEAEEENDEESFDKINLSIRESDKQNIIVLILNPTTKEHWIYKRFFEETGVQPGANIIKENVCYIHTDYRDIIEHIPPDYLQEIELLKKNNPKKYQHIILGGWLDKAEGAIFENWQYGEFDPSLRFFYGMDFGFFPDPDVLVQVAIDKKNKKLYVKELLQMNNAGVDQLARQIQTVADPSIPIIADSAEKRLINDLIVRNIKAVPVKKGAGSIVQGIKEMQDYQIIVDPESTEIGKELNNYVWHDKKNNIPVDAYNHRIDAIRYVINTVLSPIKPTKTKLIRR